MVLTRRPGVNPKRGLAALTAARENNWDVVVPAAVLAELCRGRRKQTINRLDPPDGASWILDTVSNAGMHLMGASTYAGWAGYWPNASGPFANPMRRTAIQRSAHHRADQHQRHSVAEPCPTFSQPGRDATRRYKTKGACRALPFIAIAEASAACTLPVDSVAHGQPLGLPGQRAGADAQEMQAGAG